MTLDTNKANEKLLTTIQQEYKILAEYKMIESEKVGGVYVIPSYENSLFWFGVIFVRQGVYMDAVFRFSISLPDRFPDDKTVPAVIFDADVIHPFICPNTGNLDLSLAFPYWRTGEDHVWQILKYIHAIFADPFECCRNISGGSNKFKNSDLAELLMQNRGEFVSHVKNSIELCKSHLFDKPSASASASDDPHYIVFEKFEPDVHGPVLERIRMGKDGAASGASLVANGLSWVKEGEFKPLSID